MARHTLEFYDPDKNDGDSGSVELTDRQADLIERHPELLDLLRRFGQAATDGARLEVMVEKRPTSAMDRLHRHDIDGQPFVTIPVPPQFGE